METRVNDFYLKEPVGKLILKFAIPSITALLVSSLYNIVDQIFIGHGVGYLGNAATNVVYPITIIAQAIALLIGDGCAAYLSICQGKKDLENAQKSVGNALTLMILCAMTVFIFFFCTKESILWLFGATENNISYTKEYFNYILIGMPFFMLGGALPCIIRADGSPRFAMAATLTGCVMNVILDPIAIFVLHMGMKGAAIATVLGQIASAGICVYYLFHAKSFRLTKKRPDIERFCIKSESTFGYKQFSDTGFHHGKHDGYEQRAGGIWNHIHVWSGYSSLCRRNRSKGIRYCNLGHGWNCRRITAHHRL